MDWQLWDDRRHGRLTATRSPRVRRTAPETGHAPEPVEPRCSPPWHPDDVLEPRYRWTFPQPVDPSPTRSQPRPGWVCRPGWPACSPAVARSTADDIAAWFADPLDGLHDPRSLPDADLLSSRLRAAREPRRAGPGLRRLRRRRDDRAGDPDPRPAPVRGRGRPVRPEPARRGPRPVARRDRRGRRAGRHASSSPSTAARRASPRSPPRTSAGIDVIITDHHRVPAVLPAAIAIVNPHRPDATYPDRRLAGSGVAFKVAQLLLADEPGGAAAALDLADLATIGTVADVAPIVGENRAIARLGLERLRRAPRPGIAALLERAPDRAGGRRPRDGLVRHRAAAQRGRAGGGGPRGRAAAAGRRPGRGGDPCRRPRGGQPDPARPDEDGRRRGAGAVAGDEPPMARRSSAVRGPSGSSGSSPPASPRSEAGRRSSGPTSATSSGRRAGATARSTSARRSSAAATSSSATAATPARPGFEIATERWDAFRERFLALAADRAPRDPRARRSPSTWPCRPPTSTTPCIASWPRSRRAARGTPSRSSPSSG